MPDSSLPIELWTADGRRVLHVGLDVRGDSLIALRPELRAGDGRAITEVPTGRAGGDSILYGAFYQSAGRVLFWTVVPVVEDGRRLGYIAQERAFRSTPQAQSMMRELLGNDAALNVHNTVNGFWASYAGEAIPPLKGVDTVAGDFIGVRPRRGRGDRVGGAGARHAVDLLDRGAAGDGARRAAHDDPAPRARHRGRRACSACWPHGWRAAASPIRW